MRKWPLQLRQAAPDGMSGSSNGSSLQQQEMSMIQERNLPSSPSPLYSPHSKASGYMKGGLGQPAARKQLMGGGHSLVDSSRGLLQWVQSITFVAVSIDHSLSLVFQADSSTPGSYLPFLLFDLCFSCFLLPYKKINLHHWYTA